MHRNFIESEHSYIKQKSFCSKVILGQNTSSTESLHTCSLQYERKMLHVTLKFALHSWQVPRSSVGRALYRESGPSQDGDPVPGNLPCFSLRFFFFFSRRFVSFLISYQDMKECGVSLHTRLFYFNTIEKASFHLLTRLAFS